jgi:ribosome recycling factor
MSQSDDVLKEFKAKVEKAVEGLKMALAKFRTGRASLSLLDGIRVNYYGSPTPLNGCAALGVPEPRLITIKPYDKGVLKEIEKAIREANLGLNPVNDGELIRLPIPPLTEARRKEIAKQVRTRGEEHKVSIRNERRDANEVLKGLQKDKLISEDESKRVSEKVQKETDAGIARIDALVEKKEKEVMEV